MGSIWNKISFKRKKNEEKEGKKYLYFAKISKILESISKYIFNWFLSYF